jgi:hypothetical protein
MEAMSGFLSVGFASVLLWCSKGAEIFDSFLNFCVIFYS